MTTANGSYQVAFTVYKRKWKKSRNRTRSFAPFSCISLWIHQNDEINCIFQCPVSTLAIAFSLVRCPCFHEHSSFRFIANGRQHFSIFYIFKRSIYYFSLNNFAIIMLMESLKPKLSRHCQPTLMMKTAMMATTMTHCEKT